MKSFLLLQGLFLLGSTGASRLPADGLVKVLQTLLTKERGNQTLVEKGEVEEFRLSPSYTEVFWQLQKLLSDTLE